MTVPVCVAFQRLFCYHGSDESDSEPYLWTIGFTLDGRTLTHAPDSTRLSGAPGWFSSPGSHGSIGGPMPIGSERSIPPAVGRFATTLQPIVLHVGGRALEVPGLIALIGVLLEEDSTSDEGAEAAHQAVDALVRAEVTEAVTGLDLAGLAVRVGQSVTAGGDPVEAARAVFREEVERVTARIQRYARATAVDAIVQRLSFPSAIVEAADPDEFLGVGVHVFTQESLAATEHTRRLDFTDTIAQPGVHLEASDYVFNLHGAAWQRIERYTIPITDQVPPGRWQVTGVLRTGRPGKQFISTLGGQFSDGTPWVLTKNRAMEMLVAGSHTFFVRGDGGAEAEVVVDPEPVNPLFPALTTRADDDPSNNLSALPPCPVSTSHTRPFDG